MIKINESNVTIMVKDMAHAIAFYESIGLKLKKNWDNHYAMIETAGITLGLHPGREKDSTNSNISIGFMIDDGDEAKTLLENNNIVYEEADGGSGYYLHFHDLDGTLLYFTKPKWNY